MKSHIFVEYQKEREQLSSQKIDKILQAGRKWDLSSCLSRGGVVIFPHTYLRVCGQQIAAAVHSALDSGADQVLAIGVLHSQTEEMDKARSIERAHEDISHITLRGVHGPGLSRGAYWQEEYSLLSFVFLWEEEIKRRGLKHPPKLIVRYPYLVNCTPQDLPGIEELQLLARDAAVVASADFCHHGIAYGQPRETVRDFGPDAEGWTRKNIETHLQILAEQEAHHYYEHCLKIHSDAFDVGTILRYLRGPLQATICDLVLCDAAALFDGQPSPSWVAASLVALTKNIGDCDEKKR